jgi:hypothetical protein
VSPRRARGRSFPGARVPGMLIAAGASVSVAAFAFCLAASADGWHRAVTGPGIMRTCHRCGQTAGAQCMQRSTHAYSVKYECIDRRACARREAACATTNRSVK